ncbi:hypothetical protein NLJ89_g11401 [Agrocybe chaxingu]|uniref:Uncharacterized protein n=1 Tax=Agrocybe chaxingu TaxID=84603 RepID=A0A9W8JP99_9AGAR|nr:hypothetical protein NLJ89_g11401 [Agrocybe chaxingu]
MRSLLQHIVLAFGKFKAPTVAPKPALLRVKPPSYLSLPVPTIPARYHVRIHGTHEKGYREAELIGSLREAMESQTLQLVLHHKLGYLPGGIEVAAMKCVPQPSVKGGPKRDKEPHYTARLFDATGRGLYLGGLHAYPLGTYRRAAFMSWHEHSPKNRWRKTTFRGLKGIRPLK